MILRPFSLGLDRFADTTYFFSQRLGLDVVVPAPIADVESLLLVGNGTPDNYVLCILAHHLDGRKIVGFAKHEELRHLAVLNDIRTYVEASEKLVNLLLLVDRESCQLDALTEDILRRLRESGVSYGEVRDEGHIKEVILLKDEHEVRLVVVISDMGREDIIKHSIEEHLLLVAEDILGTDYIINMIRRAGGDAKRAWNSLGKEKQHRVFRYLIAQPDAAERAFPQHLEALRKLDN